MQEEWALRRRRHWLPCTSSWARRGCGREGVCASLGLHQITSPVTVNQFPVINNIEPRSAQRPNQIRVLCLVSARMLAVPAVRPLRDLLA
jgi:hypothetical protein